MARGGKRPGAGRPPGAVNEATKNAREAIAMFVDGNAHRLEGWLDKIATDNPKQAFDCFMSVVEYHIPKLMRSENQNLDSKGEPTDPPTAITSQVLSVLTEEQLKVLENATDRKPDDNNG